MKASTLAAGLVLVAYFIALIALLNWSKDGSRSAVPDPPAPSPTPTLLVEPKVAYPVVEIYTERGAVTKAKL